MSVAFAGFSGVVGVFGGGSDLSEEERSFRLGELISLGLTAFFASLLPLVLAQFVETESIVWLISCAALAAYFGYSAFAIRRKMRQLADRLPKSTSATIVLALHPFVVLVLILGAFGILLPHAAYVAGVTWALVLGARHFALLVARSNPRPAV